MKIDDFDKVIEIYEGMFGKRPIKTITNCDIESKDLIISNVKEDIQDAMLYGNIKSDFDIFIASFNKKISKVSGLQSLLDNMTENKNTMFVLMFRKSTDEEIENVVSKLNKFGYELYGASVNSLMFFNKSYGKELNLISCLNEYYVESYDNNPDGLQYETACGITLVQESGSSVEITELKKRKFKNDDNKVINLKMILDYFEEAERVGKTNIIKNVKIKD